MTLFGGLQGAPVVQCGLVDPAGCCGLSGGTFRPVLAEVGRTCGVELSWLSRAWSPTRGVFLGSRCGSCRPGRADLRRSSSLLGSDSRCWNWHLGHDWCWAGGGGGSGLGCGRPAGRRRPALEETLLAGLGGLIVAFAAWAWDFCRGVLLM
ncbi:hypothetical protein NDU88_004776 [Pleurodeles waltl]|uniref:Uncharacterized protein n=1 Tax=Pleurodeles waltl TaxID=8319 RepID=A0AAV7T9C6_PLEWA|nr:hypothetical protein NDU88_004776 [Pleurodeles waltl]